MVDLVEFSVVDITKGRMDIQLCGHGRGWEDGQISGCPQNHPMKQNTW
jgi:hypothetical protein